MKDRCIYDRDITLAITIALVGLAIGVIMSMLFWSPFVESLGHLFDH